MTKIIAELGINHYGSIKICKKMIDQSLNAGCWGIKFQYRNLKRNYIYNKNNSEIGLEIINREVKKNYLKPNIIKKLSNYARNLGLKVGISFFRSEDINDFKNVNEKINELHKVEMEDEKVVLNVQKGIQSRFYKNGRYSANHEQGTHYFHQLICKYLSK